MNTVVIRSFSYDYNHRLIKIGGTGHATEFVEACRDIAVAVMRGRYRWWFQTIHGELSRTDSELVSDMKWEVFIEFGD
jgi:hypothetical protein